MNWSTPFLPLMCHDPRLLIKTLMRLKWEQGGWHGVKAKGEDKFPGNAAARYEHHMLWLQNGAEQQSAQRVRQHSCCEKRQFASILLFAGHVASTPLDLSSWGFPMKIFHLKRVPSLFLQARRAQGAHHTCSGRCKQSRTKGVVLKSVVTVGTTQCWIDISC